MGESVTEGTISRWLKAVGDSVNEGETLVEVTTDKVDVEVPSPAAGTLESIVAQEGDTVSVGATLATIAAGANGATAPGKAPSGEGSKAAESNGATDGAPADDGVRPQAPTVAEVEDTPPSPPSQSNAAAPSPPARGARAGIAVSPLARRAAALHGVDIQSVTG